MRVPPPPTTVRQAWLSLFMVFIVLQVILLAFGLVIGTKGQPLDPVAAQKLDSMSRAILSVVAVGVVACLVVARAKLHPKAVSTPQDLFRGTFICLAIGEATVLLALVGLAKLHLDQFLIACGLVFLADFALVLPSGLKLLNLPSADKSK